jgi:hypothetical protein
MPRVLLASTDAPLDALRDALARVAVIVCELEIGETSTAYMVASDLELDLERALADCTAAGLRRAA